MLKKTHSVYSANIGDVNLTLGSVTPVQNKIFISSVEHNKFTALIQTLLKSLKK